MLFKIKAHDWPYQEKVTYHNAMARKYKNKTTKKKLLIEITYTIKLQKQQKED